MNAHAPIRNDPTWWRNALAGRRQELPSRAPQYGFFRDRQRAVGFWYGDDGELLCSASSGFEPEEPDEISDLFGSACVYPIPHEVFTAISAGQEWPPHLLVDLTHADIKAGVAWSPAWAKARFDERQAQARAKRETDEAQQAEEARIAAGKDVTAETEAAGAELPKVGHNSGAPHELARDELNAVLAAFRRWFREELAGKIEDEAASLKAKGFQEQANAIRLDASKKHKAEKAPVLEQSRAIDAKWITGPDSIVEQAKRLEELIQKERTPFEVAEAKRKREAEAEAARLRKAEEDKRRLEQARADAIPQEQFELPAATPKSPAAAPAKKTTKTVEILVFDDPVAVFTHLAKLSTWHLDASQLAQRTVRKIIAGGTKVPGARIVTEEVAR